MPSLAPTSRKVIPGIKTAALSTGGSAKIDGAYSYGGANAAVATVEQDFGVHIDDYIWIGLLGLEWLVRQRSGYL